MHRAVRHLRPYVFRDSILQTAQGTSAQLDSSCSCSGGVAREACSDLNIQELVLQAQDIVFGQETHHTASLRACARLDNLGPAWGSGSGVLRRCLSVM